MPSVEETALIREQELREGVSLQDPLKHDRVGRIVQPIRAQLRAWRDSGPVGRFGYWALRVLGYAVVAALVVFLFYLGLGLLVIGGAVWLALAFARFGLYSNAGLRDHERSKQAARRQHRVTR